jgi:hypothetical protein
MKERFGGGNGAFNKDDVLGVVTQEDTLDIIEQVAKLALACPK